LSVDSELLPESQLHNGLVLAIPEEGEGASKQQDRETDQVRHGGHDSA
jgi:hypothetical protein